MNWHWLKPKLAMIATLPLYFFFAYILMLGLQQFFEIHPRICEVSLMVFGYALPIVAGGIISWRVIQAKRAFHEGLRDGRHRNVTNG